MDRWLNIGVLGGACWPTNESKITFGGRELILKPATKDTEQSIHINLKGISDIEARTLINRFLSILAWSDEQGMEDFDGWSGTPIPCAVPRKSRVLGSILQNAFSKEFPFYREIEREVMTLLFNDEMCYPPSRRWLEDGQKKKTDTDYPFAILSQPALQVL